MEYKCGICLENYEENNIVKNCNDKHYLCNTCFNELLQIHLYEETPIICPICRNEIQYIKNGLLITYYTSIDNKIYSKINYVNNIPEGTYELYYESGRLSSKYFMKNGKIHGLRLEYYDNTNDNTNDNTTDNNSNIWLKCYYNNGIKDGLFEEYYENGVLWRTCHYTNGLKTGLYKEYNINGDLINSVNFD
jgi:antitoxin component YwqK of YwqJK toxin-antitoxin module